MSSPASRWLKRILMLGLLAMGLGIALNSLAIYQLLKPFRLAIPTTVPTDASTVQLASDSGAQLHGWLFAPPHAKAAVVLMHGYRGNRSAHISRARWLYAKGYAVLIFDFQAHGQSSGDWITIGLRESADAHAAVRWMRQRFPTLKLGAIGVSQGGAAALLGPSVLPVDALVLEAVYPTIEEASHNRVRRHLPDWLSRLAVQMLLFQARYWPGIDTSRLRPIERIGEVTAPLLMLAGTADTRTPLTESQRLYAAATAPKQLWLVEGAEHQNLMHFAPQQYQAKVGAFLQQHLLP